MRVETHKLAVSHCDRFAFNDDRRSPNSVQMDSVLGRDVISDRDDRNQRNTIRSASTQLQEQSIRQTPIYLPNHQTHQVHPSVLTANMIKSGLYPVSGETRARPPSPDRRPVIASLLLYCCDGRDRDARHYLLSCALPLSISPLNCLTC